MEFVIQRINFLASLHYSYVRMQNWLKAHFEAFYSKFSWLYKKPRSVSLIKLTILINIMLLRSKLTSKICQKVESLNEKNSTKSDLDANFFLWKKAFFMGNHTKPFDFSLWKSVFANLKSLRLKLFKTTEIYQKFTFQNSLKSAIVHWRKRRTHDNSNFHHPFINN